MLCALTLRYPEPVATVGNSAKYPLAENCGPIISTNYCIYSKITINYSTLTRMKINASCPISVSCSFQLIAIRE